MRTFGGRQPLTGNDRCKMMTFDGKAWPKLRRNASLSNVSYVEGVKDNWLLLMILLGNYSQMQSHKVDI